MEQGELARAVEVAKVVARELGLRADEAVVLSNSNRAMVRLTPGDALVRVTPARHRTAAPFEVEAARQLALADAPVAGLDPRVEAQEYERDGFALTFWSYFEPVPGEVTPAEYARALERLHAGLHVVELATPHFTDRVAEAQRLVDTPEATPALGDEDRALLGMALRELTADILARGRPQQLLHGEPHTGNLLRTSGGWRFIDLETMCRGPVEFDIAHASAGVEAEYTGADIEMVRECRLLVLAMVAAWRWDSRDEFPDGRRMGILITERVRRAMERRFPRDG